MKTSLILFTILAVLVLTSTPATNPATLPNHPGYPMDRATDPVTGQPLANDPGQGNATTGQKALMEAAAFEDTHVMQSLSASPNEQEIRDKLSPTASPKKEQTENKDVGKRE